MIMDVPDAQLSEYLTELRDQYDVDITKGRLSQILKELGIMHKKIYIPHF